jgi:hypothetical protein
MTTVDNTHARQALAVSTQGKHANVVTVTLARELVGCMWVIAQEIPVTA